MLLTASCGIGQCTLTASKRHGKVFTSHHLDLSFNATVDAALVLQNLIVAAEAVGLGTCPISVIRDHSGELSAPLDVPDHVFPVAGLCRG